MSQIPPDNNPYQAKVVPDKPDQWGEPQQTSGKAIASLLLGLLSFFTCGIAGVISLILGFTGLSDIKNSQGSLKGSGFATTAIIIASPSFTHFLRLHQFCPIGVGDAGVVVAARH